MSGQIDLNSPDTRQALITERLNTERVLVAKTIALELGVSLDTVRRDLMALEDAGILKRVKGGAVPITKKHAPVSERIKDKTSWIPRVNDWLPSLLQGVNTLYLDGGSATFHLVNSAEFQFAGQVITPSPLIATSLLELDISTTLIGGKLSQSGGIATGAKAVMDISDCHADLAILGTCGLELAFGLSAENQHEAEVKRAMTQNSDKTAVLVHHEKMNIRAPFKVIETQSIDLIITNASATAAYRELEIEILDA
ncbi:DeoR/GlpR family DNA-binding transcription regulator [Endozoicomonas arenosclerae]|uniref:DeoR/GlpR family DNA-binding transcription regulator n=1 Tax=Endozoicomonas arenosclerae TaxID=1633495 RepID=UPI000786741F|nr:DeoR/GlpR family DNA-binding transcription regulator [Endozoicomonas arenosclerae]